MLAITVHHHDVEFALRAAMLRLLVPRSVEATDNSWSPVIPRRTLLPPVMPRAG